MFDGFFCRDRRRILKKIIFTGYSRRLIEDAHENVTEIRAQVGAIGCDLQKQRTENKLKIAFIHLNVRHKNLEVNRQNIIELNRKAADRGADMILNPELAVSGYSFLSRNDITKYVISKDDCLLTSLSEIAKEHGVYIIIGLAERDNPTQIYYNSAIIIGSDGRRKCAPMILI